MFSFSNLCFLCLNTYKNLKTLLFEDIEGILVQNKLKHCLPEIVDSHLEIPQYICSNCMSKLDCFYKFKQSCLQNNTTLRKYLQTLTPTDKTHKHLSVILTDIKHQKIPQTESNHQTLPGIAEDLGTREEEDNSIRIKEEETDLDIEESHPLLDEEEHTDVKEECLTSEDNVNNEFYHEFVKCESAPSDSEVYSSNSEDILEDYNSSNSEKKKSTVTNKAKETKIFQCTLCNRGYAHKISLDYHYKVHSGIKNFNCSVCNKKFRQTSELLRHERIHTGVRNYECSICNKKFKQRIHLTEHEKIHTGVRNFNCSVCNKQFMRKTNLNRHEQIHTGVRNFECSVCNKKFRDKCNLSVHEKTHAAM